MAEELGARLVRAGLIGREQLAELLAEGPASGGGLVARAVDEGIVSQEALLQLLLADGYGPLQDAHDLGRAAPQVTARVPASMAQALLALPVRVHGEAVIVAMADPSDRHAVGELERLLGQPVRPKAAQVSDLRAALQLAYPARPPAPERPSTAPPSRPSAPIGPSPDDDEPDALPLVRPKPVPRPIRRTFRRPAASPPSPAPSDRGDRVAKPAPEPRVAKPAPEPRVARPAPEPRVARPAPEPRVARPAPEARVASAEASWADLLPPAPPKPRDVDVRATLAALKAARDRDAILRTACEGALPFARVAVFLALRGSTFRGWTGAGQGVVPDALRNLWIPSTSPSMFREVLRTGEPHHGPYGTTAADELFRAAIGSRGGSVAVLPVPVAHKVVGLLCADEVAAESLPPLEDVALATGGALRRLIVDSR